jgi:hypothetical protein
MAFDFDSPSVPDTAVADVVADITSHGQLPPLSDEERHERWLNNQLYLAECREREEQRASEYRQQQAEAESIARQEAALEQAEANRKARLERQEQISRQVRDRELADLRFQSTQQRAWQSNVEHAARVGLVQRQRRTLMDELDAMINPPQPQPEPTVYVGADEGSPDLGDPDFNVKAWMQKPRPWWS